MLAVYKGKEPVNYLKVNALESQGNQETKPVFFRLDTETFKMDGTSLSVS
jgi:hypothetical protein